MEPLLLRTIHHMMLSDGPAAEKCTKIQPIRNKSEAPAFKAKSEGTELHVHRLRFGLGSKAPTIRRIRNDISGFDDWLCVLGSSLL